MVRDFVLANEMALRSRADMEPIVNTRFAFLFQTFTGQDMGAHGSLEHGIEAAA